MLLSGAQIKPHKNTLRVGEVPDYFSYWRGKFSDQSGNGQDLVSPSKGRVFQEVDDFNRVPAVKMFFADSLEIGKSLYGFWRVTR